MNVMEREYNCRRRRFEREMAGGVTYYVVYSLDGLISLLDVAFHEMGYPTTHSIFIIFISIRRSGREDGKER
jgi:hypothetical protein